MSRRPFAALLAVALLAPAVARAQATRTWVSGVGDDANPCSRTAPCKTFAGAISKTAAGGEIDVLDPGGFGAVTITKSIVIDGTAALGSVLVSGTNGIVVNAAVTDVVALRNIALNGIGLGGTGSPGLTGVLFTAGGALHVEGCTISGFSQDGIRALNGGKLQVAGTVIRAVGGSAIALGGATTATVERSHLAAGATAISAIGTSRATVHDTVVTGFTTAGIYACPTTDPCSAEVNVDHGLVAGNVVGVQADTGSTVRLSDVMVGQNTTGLVGNVASFGNNRVAAGNGTDGTPATTLPQQ